jgi:hypothetical protein
VSVPREFRDRRGTPEQGDRHAPADEPSQRPGEQLELQDELDAAEGFDGWDVFEQSEDEAA